MKLRDFWDYYVGAKELVVFTLDRGCYHIKVGKEHLIPSYVWDFAVIRHGTDGKGVVFVQIAWYREQHARPIHTKLK